MKHVAQANNKNRALKTAIKKTSSGSDNSAHQQMIPGTHHILPHIEDGLRTEGEARPHTQPQWAQDSLPDITKRGKLQVFYITVTVLLITNLKMKLIL